ncbi:MAG: ABC transporter permease [Candidatus Omnitrophica bacterium]|nr:ABC transporter permease [Candidatus Omnitrophota bacterium]
MRYEFSLAIRYLLTKRHESFISIVTLMSVLGVAVGVTALIVVLSVMNGFDRDLRDKFIGVQAQLVVQAPGGIVDASGLDEIIHADPEVVASAPFIQGQAMLRTEGSAFGVMVRGVDSARESQVTNVAGHFVQGSLKFPEAMWDAAHPKGDRDERPLPGVAMGLELAHRLGLGLGSEVSLISPVDSKRFPVQVSGLFNTGMYEFDSTLIYLDIAHARRVYDVDELITGFAVKLKDAEQVDAVKKNLRRALPFGIDVYTWKDLNRTLFAALALERTVMFVIVGLVVLVACFGITSSMIMNVMERTRDVGTLRAVGATRWGIRLLFLIEGALVGLIGALLGYAGGMGLCYVLETYPFITLPADIYYLEHLPVQVVRADVIKIVVSAFFLSLLAAVYPAHRASQLDPVQALRYE